jgi:hypothetical protein
MRSRFILYDESKTYNYLVYRNFLDITPLQLDIQKLSGYFPISSVYLPHLGWIDRKFLPIHPLSVNILLILEK